MILIRNAQIIDGTGKPPYQADVLIKKGTISAIGNLPKHQAQIVIDGLGAMLTPGFVDVNTDADHYLSILRHPTQLNFLSQGVTTIVGGHCGSSLAPLLYGSLESVRKWADIRAVSVNWHTVREFLHVLERRGLGVNFGMLIGHSTIRRALIGETLRDLTLGELKVFSKIVRDGLNDGALGLSTGLGYAHSRQVPYAEIKMFARLVHEAQGVYSTHLRDEHQGLTAATWETLKLARETGVKTLISHFRPLRGFEHDFSEGLGLINKEARDLDIHFDSYPSDTSLVPIYTLLPDWVKNGGLEVMLQNISEKYLAERILEELPAFRDKDIIVAQAPLAPYLVGKTLGEIAKNQSIDLRNALLKIMAVSRLRAVVFYKNINMDLAIQSLLEDKALVASNGPGVLEAEAALAVRHERILNTFPKFLEIVTKLKLMPLTKAIEKITSVPAKLFSFNGRGEIKEGNIADLVMMKDYKITHIMVNGTLVVRDGVFQNIRAGKVLRRL